MRAPRLSGLSGFLAAWLLLGLPTAQATSIDFDDVLGSEVDLTTRYSELGITFNAIANPFALSGTFPAPSVLPTVLGGVTTWLDPFDAAFSAPQVAVAAPTAQTGIAGNGGILMSFAFEVTSVSLVGVDRGFGGGGDEIDPDKANYRDTSIGTTSPVGARLHMPTYAHRFSTIHIAQQGIIGSCY